MSVITESSAESEKVPFTAVRTSGNGWTRSILGTC